MSSTILLIVLLSAHITGLISEQLLNATVGGSVLFHCPLHDNGNLSQGYWQEDKQHFFLWENGNITKIPNTKYENRIQVFPNISFRLDNISPEDDQKTFFAYVKFNKQMQSERRCESRLQVSAPYQHLNLTVNHTTKSATCSARGGYPAAQVSWKGQNRSSDAELDLQDAEPSPQQDPTKKTFSFTSSVNITGLKSVTCFVYNPRSHETVNRTVELVEIDPEALSPMQTISTPSPKEDKNERSHVAAIAVPVVLVILIPSIAGAVWFYLWYKRKPPAQATGPPNPPPVRLNAQDGAQAEDPDQDPAADQTQAPDPDPANQPAVELCSQDRAQDEADAPEAAVLVSKDGAVFRRRTRSRGSANRDTDEDAADSPEKEKLLENRSSVYENLDQN